MNKVNYLENVSGAPYVVTSLNAYTWSYLIFPLHYILELVMEKMSNAIKMSTQTVYKDMEQKKPVQASLLH